MRLEEAEDLAARTLAAIYRAEGETRTGHPIWPHYDVDRERVASDLAGLRECWAHHEGGRPFGLTALMATRYADGLRRTAALYGVTP